MANKSGKMAVNMMASGRMIRLMGMVFSSMPMATSMKALGAMIRHMAMELTSMLTVLLTSENGSKTSSMVAASKNGQMVPNMRVNTKTAKNTVKAV